MQLIKWFTTKWEREWGLYFAIIFICVELPTTWQRFTFPIAVVTALWMTYRGIKDEHGN